MAQVRVSVLGPLDVSMDGSPVDVSGPLPRRLLAVLDSRVPQAVPADALIDALWRGVPPAGAAQTLQSHIARLRRQLPPEAISTTRQGYRLEAVVDATQLDTALRTLDARRAGKAADWLHRGVVVASGAVGGAAGLPGLAVELPFSLTVMLRAIADHARAQGEDLGMVAARLECLDDAGPAPASVPRAVDQDETRQSLFSRPRCDGH